MILDKIDPLIYSKVPSIYFVSLEDLTLICEKSIQTQPYNLFSFWYSTGPRPKKGKLHRN
jgi:hypothetical protein